MNTHYAVTAVYADGNEQVSRFFDTLRAARRWAKWLASQDFARKVRIMAGGPGGMEVK
jgi:hypothetical protein